MNDIQIKHMLEVFYVFNTGICDRSSSIMEDVKYLQLLYDNNRKDLDHKDACIKAKTQYIKERLLKLN